MHARCRCIGKALTRTAPGIIVACLRAALPGIVALIFIPIPLSLAVFAG